MSPRPLLLLLALALPACASPIALEHALLGYDEKVSQIEAQSLLVNVARAEQGLPLHFTTVSAITASFLFEVETELDAQLELSPERSGGLGARLGTHVSESPTISIVPMQGEEYARRVLTPVQGQAFAFLAHQDRCLANLLRLTGQALLEPTGGRREFHYNDPETPGYARFRQLVARLDGLFHAGRLDVGEVTLGGRTRVLLADYDTAHLGSAQRAALGELAAGYPENFLLVDLQPAAAPAGGQPFRGLIKLRSFHEIVHFVARGLAPDFEREVEPDSSVLPAPPHPRRTLTVSRAEGAPAVFRASWQGQSYALPLLPDPALQRWNARSFRILHHLLQLTVQNHSTPAPALTIGAGAHH